VRRLSGALLDATGAAPTKCSETAPDHLEGMPMPRTLIDISVPLKNDVTSDPPGNHPTIQYIDHQQSLPRMLQFFDGLRGQDLPDGQGWAVEQVSLSTYNGTHLDAP
jgi:hypothetical protein